MPLSDVQVGFVQSVFVVNEANGPIFVCIEIFGADLNRSVTVLLSTQDNTAICKFAFT